ncbi:MAG: mucoidy inhibitor MuiA family protein [Alphaproteobacteria bacterium]|nr:MAG: mucoidy inhibitor MuiA family protein [Alphaproteobacteria bacterium]
MKKLLIASVIFSLVGISAGYAQDYFRAQDKFEDFTAKMKAAKGKEGGSYMDAAPSINSEPAPFNVPAPGDRPPPSPSVVISAESGDPNAMMILSDQYNRGDGVPQNHALAYQWALMAAQVYKAQGNSDGMITAIKRKTAITKMLSQTEKTNVEQLLANWRPEKVVSKLEPSGNDAPAQDDPFADMVVAKSEIKAVTVYNNRAKVTRVAEVEIPAGAHTVAFKDLPAMLLPDSLRAEGSAKAAVKFGAISHKQIMVSQLTSPRERELHDKLESLNDQKRPLEADKEVLEAQKTFLTNIGQQATLRNNENLAQIDLKPDQWVAAQHALRDGLSEIKGSAEQLYLKQRDLDREIQKTQLELNQVRTGQQSIFIVLVPLESEKATKLAIELSYQVPNATWKPIYDARVNTEDKSDLKLAQYGSVRQQTGEDWTGVSLTLSTAQPQRGTSLPDLRPMWIDTYEPLKQTLSLPATPNAPQGDPLAEWRGKTEAKRVKMEQEQQPEEREVEQPDQIAVFSPAVINTGGFVSEYKIPGPANVPSDGTESKLLVGNFDIESKLQIHIKPQMSTDAYLVVHSKLKGDSPVLPGQVNLFRDEAYVGQSTLPLLRPDEEYDLYFGVDDQVAVKRKVLKDESSQAGIITKDKVLTRNFVTELQNLHKTPVDIVVKETIPSPRNERIHVDIAKDTTTPGYVADADNIKGLLNWQFKMEPKEKKNLKLDWTVSWPSDFVVTGL